MHSFWKNKKGIIICTDELLDEVKIKNAKHVIHFTLPTSKFRAFENRFSTQCAFPKRDDNKQQVVTCLIFLDENNANQIPKMFELMERGQQKLPEKYKQIGQVK